MSIEEQQAQLRRQLESRGITDARVLDAIERTRRDLFVPPDERERAYEDNALPIGQEQTISQPYIVGLMTQELALRGDERVLEVGTGSGYQTAILARLCREIVTIERFEELSRSARAVLSDQGFRNIDFRIGDGTLGCRERAPYDAILVTAGAPDVPAPLFNQLNFGGRMIIPIGDEESQDLTLVEKLQAKPRVRKLCGCRFVKLVGNAGWPG